jgi:hypothetical protein
MHAIKRHPWIALAMSVLVLVVLWTLIFVVFADGSGDAGLGPMPG